MLQKWLSLLRRPQPGATGPTTPQSNAAPRATQGVAASAVQPPAYPPVDQGLPVSTPEGLLAANAELIDRLRLHAATDVDTFRERFEVPLLNLAEQINALPATSSGLFAGEGGLFRASLEMAFFSFQAADGRIFTGTETVERRHALEGRWRYVCFLAGMFYPLGTSLDTIIVTSSAGGVWRRHFGSLTSWAQQNEVTRLFAAWPNVDENLQQIGPSSHIASLIATVAGAKNLQWLEDGSSELVKAVYEISSGHTTTARNCKDVVVSMWERIARREEARRPQAFGRQVVGTHLGPYLVGAIRSLLGTPAWKLNGDRVKADSSGLYLLWPQAIEDLAAFGVKQGYQGWPATAGTIAELLRASQVVINSGEDLGMVEVVGDEGEIVKALKLKNPLSVLEDFDPETFASQSPKTLEAVIAADPLAAAEAKAEATQAAGRKRAKEAPAAAAKEAVEPAPSIPEQTTEALFVEEEQPQVQPEAVQSPVVERSRAEVTSEVANKTEAAAVTEVSQPDTSAIREAAEVRFSDLVPQEVQKDIKKRLHVELLGKVIKAWRDRGENSKSMRMTDNGAAITVVFLGTIVRDVASWVGEMAAAGLIYSPPSTPGLKINKVSIPEGAPPKEAVILSRFAVKKLGL